MSLQFIAGCSGSGKSYQLYQTILKEAGEHPKFNYLIVVPEQFTLQTQKDIVTLSPRQGILNVDVLSFNRLAYRVFEEVGFQNARGTLIDDMGKNLILRRLAGQYADKLPVLGAGLKQIGYINEIKSVLSEFMQYGIGEKEQEKLIEEAKTRPVLQEKLKELHMLYNIFNSYIDQKYVTTEELLIRVSYCISESRKLKTSVISFDGFTGFTPVQNKVIEALMENCQKVLVTVLTDHNAWNNNNVMQEHELFYLSKKMVKTLKNTAKKSGVEIEPDFFIDSKVPARYLAKQKATLEKQMEIQDLSGVRESTEEVKTPKLIFLERNLFRHAPESYEGSNSEDLNLFLGEDRGEEVIETAIRIRELVSKNNYSFHDIAVITGDINLYQHVFERVFSRYEIPFFIDRNIPIRMNPFTEFIKAALDVLSEDYSYPAVMRYLRSSLTDFDVRQIDLLENYLLAFGIRGYTSWNKPFQKQRKTMAEEELSIINELRERILAGFRELEKELFAEEIPSGKGRLAGRSFPVKRFVLALYHFIERNRSAQKLNALADILDERGDESRGKEMTQIYQKVLELLEQLSELLGDEEITVKEFSELMSAGFDEIRIGVIPQSQDYVQIGDITRSRLRKIKALFFVGVNDGIIPKSGGKGGLISDLDREFLTGNKEEIAMAPTKREEAFTQRLYLYMMMTKPVERLYISWSELDEEGNSAKPSYLIKILCDMFPKQRIDLSGHLPERRIVNEKTAIWELSEEIRTYIRDFEKKSENSEKNPSIKYLTLYNTFQYDNTLKMELREITDAAFDRGINSYQTRIDKAIANVIYGREIVGGITRLEQYAACAYSHFLSYGLKLKERDEFSFEARKLGSAFHDSLMVYGNLLKERNLSWTEVTTEERENIIAEAMEKAINMGDYGAIYSSFRSTYMKERLKRILNRSVDTLTCHLKQGSFLPFRYELPFYPGNGLQSFVIDLSEDESLQLVGRIDRIDTCEDDENVYVKVIDYKSGDETLELSEVYKGLRLQLVVYLSVALEYVKHLGSETKNVLPAGTLYYHIDDPIVDVILTEGKEETAEETEKRIRDKLRMKGLVNSEKKIYSLLDKALASEGVRSSIVPVRLKADGTFYEDSGVVSSEDFVVLSDFAEEKLKELGRGILAGDIRAARKEKDQSEDCCGWCLYKTICKRKGNSAGVKDVSEKKSRREILALMKEKIDGRV